MIQENDSNVKSGNGNGSSTIETGKKREADTSNVEKVLHLHY